MAWNRGRNYKVGDEKMDSKKVWEQLGKLEGLGLKSEIDRAMRNALNMVLVEYLETSNVNRKLDEAIDNLLASGIGIDCFGRKAMYIACRDRDLQNVIRLVEAGHQPSEQIFSDVCSSNAIEIMKYFFDQGMKVTITQEALLNPCRHQRKDMLKILFEQGIKFSQKALHSICLHGEIDLIKLMLDSYPHSAFNIDQAIEFCNRENRRHQPRNEWPSTPNHLPRSKAFLLIEKQRRMNSIKCCSKKN